MSINIKLLFTDNMAGNYRHMNHTHQHCFLIETLEIHKFTDLSTPRLENTVLDVHCRLLFVQIGTKWKMEADT